jgi:hypothetical protein
MKTTRIPSSFRRIAPILALVLFLGPALRADTPAAIPEPKDHTLFMGLNLMVQQGQDYYKVLDLTENSAVIKVDGQLKQVPFSKINGYRLKKEPKIGELPAALTHLAGERAYTPANDPHRIWNNRSTQLVGYADDQADIASTNIMLDSYRAGGAAFSGTGLNATQIPNTGAAQVAAADSAKYDQGIANRPSEMDDPTIYAQRMQEDLDKKLFDAMQVDFEVSSDRTLEDPYVVVVTEFRENEKARETARWIYIKPLNSIGRQPTKVHILQGGFPKGFALGKYEVHLYDGGREIPTSVSENKMAITQGEVYMYTGFQYLLDHKGQSLPVTPIPESAPSYLRTEFSTSELNQSFEVKVNSQGRIVGLKSRSGTIAPNVQAMWQRLRFYPALDNGKPVDATLDARLADFIK